MREHSAVIRLLIAGTLAAAVALPVAGCKTSSSNKYGVTASPRVIPFGQPIPSGGGYYKVGNPYKVAGRWFHPKEDPGYDEVGLASWYGSDFHGRRTANGEIFDMGALTAAHPTLPLPTYARVTNLENGRSVVVRVNDRGPFASDRVIDLSRRTADILDFRSNGTAEVRVQYVGMAPLEGNDGQWLTTTVRNDGVPVGPVMMAGLTPPPPPPQEQQHAVASAARQPAASASPVSMGFQQASFQDTAGQPAPGSLAGPVTGPAPETAGTGGKVTYQWVSGFVDAHGADAAVAAAFRLFDHPSGVMAASVGPPR
ncbi:septal ring lytic transglycosylase RlpA family protein [Microbaculum marinum]|uniref:Endolytic peptidoglycan transglycosylase RlpA n=1 Tax=Microbaculum marinum TaxID=1764581 RepID=A0AAW9RHS2_9HYPH